jgi:NAD(P)-dependent dehydrogenase (short-subunit alcohol dehydrogenase family)
VLPHMRRQRQGLLVWVSCSSVAGGTMPYLAGHLAAKAAMDALAVQYARELARFGIETSIIVPGVFASGTDRLAACDAPADADRAAAYEDGPCAGMSRQIRDAIGEIAPEDADPGLVAGAIAYVVEAPFGERPFRVHVDPGEDGASVAFPVIDRIRDEMLKRTGFSDLLKPAIHLAHE